ncbi:hypothetical protein Aph02nite_90630 [Actinoplanes philippinensis]|uniref:Uncharacterized protein n=1 Tax=Actinoplanes philippinensis TaxID=35752 RepID=A0A1I2M9Y8_9ACTN|nr:hypothetical protein [Actinoplanes philippinensis]GIE83113.1 hypothetical protein Aph02nite_90630 [Actinoplanes philippinensis]SFF87698.1 hypothetical protein SAMN05421541_12754 [Actinoplanes philippinensis]
MTKSRRTFVLRRGTAAAVACAALLLAGCDGAAGVELSKDWSGVEVFVLSRVDDLTTVVGVDPVARVGKPLAVVPTQSDDDEVRSPQIVRLTTGEWIINIPKKDGRPSALYRIDTGGHSLERVGTVEAERALVPVGAVVAALSTAAASTAGKAEALMYDPATWKSDRAVALPTDPGLAAGGTDDLCTATADGAGSKVTVVPVGAGRAPTTTTIAQLQVQALTCDGDRVAVAGGTATGEGAGEGVRLTTVDGADVVTTAAGRVDRIAATKDALTVVVSSPAGVRVSTLRRSDGKVAGTVDLTGIDGATGLHQVTKGWLLTSGGTAAVVSPETGKAETFTLPGQLLSAD